MLESIWGRLSNDWTDGDQIWHTKLLCGLIWEWTYHLGHAKENWPHETFCGRFKGNNFKDWKISQSAENILKVDPGMGRYNFYGVLEGKHQGNFFRFLGVNISHVWTMS